MSRCGYLSTGTADYVPMSEDTEMVIVSWMFEDDCYIRGLVTPTVL